MLHLHRQTTKAQRRDAIKKQNLVLTAQASEKKKQLSNERVTADIINQLLVENSGEWMMSLKENVSGLKQTWISRYCLQTDQSICYNSIHKWKGWFISWDISFASF